MLVVVMGQHKIVLVTLGFWGFVMVFAWLHIYKMRSLGYDSTNLYERERFAGFVYCFSGVWSVGKWQERKREREREEDGGLALERRKGLKFKKAESNLSA